MILNGSRASTFQQCRTKLWNWDQLGLMSYREADPLMTGSAFHVGMASYYANKSVEQATTLAEAAYRRQLEGQMILPEERAGIEGQITLVKRSIEAYARNWRHEDIQVLMPEVKFRVELPKSGHHCYFAHRILQQHKVRYTMDSDDPNQDFCYERVPFDKCDGYDPLEPDELLPCFQPHFFAGRTDAIIQWNGQVWLLEHKTTSRTGPTYYDRFLLDTQATGYLYGIWKSLGVKPHGFILNVAKKPQAKAADPFAVTFEREPYVRTEAELLRFESDILRIAQDFEAAIASRQIYKNTHACTDFNRRCYYFDRCIRGGGLDREAADEDEFRVRSPDYVNEYYYEMLGLKQEDIHAVPPSVSSTDRNPVGDGY